MYEQILQEISQAIEAGNIADFVEQRIEQLDKAAIPKKISLIGCKFYEGFISSESEIYPSLLVSPFKIDDKQMYYDLIDAISKLKNISSTPLRSLIPSAVESTIIGYFGFWSNPKANRNFYFDWQDWDTETDELLGPIPIKEFKGKNIALCAERSAAAQNLLSFLGLKAYLIFSPECQLAPDAVEAHAYNIIKTERGYFIFDSANPSLTMDASENIINYRPAIYKISDEQFESLKHGSTVSVNHKNYIENTEQVIERIYRC